METVIVIMLKNEKTGFFEKEITSIPIPKNEDLILNIYATQNGNNIDIHLNITTDRDVLNWEYDAIYDYYDIEIFKESLSNITEAFEVEDEYNPTWKLILNYKDIQLLNDSETLKNHIYDLLNIHRQELDSVYKTIEDKKGEYDNNEQ